MKKLLAQSTPLSRRAQQSITGGATSSTPCCILRSGSGQTVVRNCRCSSYPVASGTVCRNGYVIIDDLIASFIIIEDEIVL